jgi:hypothetical protein
MSHVGTFFGAFETKGNPAEIIRIHLNFSPAV